MFPAGGHLHGASGVHLRVDRVFLLYQPDLCERRAGAGIHGKLHDPAGIVLGKVVRHLDSRGPSADGPGLAGPAIPGERPDHGGSRGMKTQATKI